MIVIINDFSTNAKLPNEMFPITFEQHYRNSIEFPQQCQISKSLVHSNRDTDMFHIIDIRLNDGNIIQASMTHFKCDFLDENIS